MIPKAVREEAGLEAGAEVDVQFRDGRIEIESTTAPVRLVREGGGVKIEAEAEMPLLTGDAVRDALERVRR